MKRNYWLKFLTVLLGNAWCSNTSNGVLRATASLIPRKFLQSALQTRYHHRVFHLVAASEALAFSSRLLSPSVFITDGELRMREGRKGSMDPSIPSKIIIGANTSVFLAWWVWALLLHSGSWDGKDWMVSHFTYSNDRNSKQSRPYLILTSAFSHPKSQHFCENMLAIHCFAPGIVSDLGYRGFAYFYMSATYGSRMVDEAIASCRANIAENAEEESNKRCAEQRSVGASGAITAMVSYHLLSLWRDGVCFGEKPDEHICALFIFIGDVFGAVFGAALKKNDKVARGVHAGGYLCGFLFEAFRAFSRRRTRIASDFSDGN